jgi:hypothetical protein
MGEIHPGIPHDLTVALKQAFHLETFIETGTFLGDSAVWASNHFKQVHTIEMSTAVYECALAKQGNVPGVEFIHGDSREVLKQLVPSLNEPALFWLDGHWSMGETYGDGDECPVLDELRVIVSANPAHFIIIDDARLFVSPPPRPHQIEQWPSIVEIIDVIQSGAHSFYVVIFEDTLIAVPVTARSFLATFCQERTTAEYALKQAHLKQGLVLLSNGIQLIGYGIGQSLKRMVGGGG